MQCLPHRVPRLRNGKCPPQDIPLAREVPHTQASTLESLSLIRCPDFQTKNRRSEAHMGFCPRLHGCLNQAYNRSICLCLSGSALAALGGGSTQVRSLGHSAQKSGARENSAERCSTSPDPYRLLG